MRIGIPSGEFNVVEHYLHILWDYSIYHQFQNVPETREMLKHNTRSLTILSVTIILPSYRLNGYIYEILYFTL